MTDTADETKPQTPKSKPPAKKPAAKKATPKKAAPKKRKLQTPPSEPTPNSKPQTQNSEEGMPPHKPVPQDFINDLKKFSEIITANPSIFEPIRDVFEYNLVDASDRKTFPKIVNAMSMLLGTQATMVLMTACHINSTAFFEDLLYAIRDEDDILKSSVGAIQHLTSLYGNRIQQAYSLSAGTMDEDWHSVDVNTYKREGENPSWIVELKLMLYNGDHALIKMTPDSALQLVDIISAELVKNVPKEAVDDMLIKKCKSNLNEFRDKYLTGSEEKTDGESSEDNPAGYA